MMPFHHSDEGRCTFVGPPRRRTHASAPTDCNSDGAVRYGYIFCRTNSMLNEDLTAEQHATA